MKKELVCVNCFSNTYPIDYFHRNKSKRRNNNCLHCLGEVVIMDSPMKLLFISLRKKGYNPQFSCSGHVMENDKYSMPYIAIKEKLNIEKDDNILQMDFRGGTAIYPREKIKSKDCIKKFLKHLKNIIDKLPSIGELKELDYYEDTKKVQLKNKNFKSSYKGNVNILIGKKRSRNYFKKNNISEIRKEVEDLDQLQSLVEKKSRWIDINNIGDILFYLKVSYLKKNIYLVVELDENFEELYDKYIFEGNGAKRSVDLMKAKTLAAALNSNLKIVYNDEVLDFWQK